MCLCDFEEENKADDMRLTGDDGNGWSEEEQDCNGALRMNGEP